MRLDGSKFTQEAGELFGFNPTVDEKIKVE